MSQFDKFSRDIQEALKSLETNITLDPYPEKHRDEAQNVANGNTKGISGDMISDFEYIFNKWSEKIEQELDTADSAATKDKDAGPMVELEYWKQRMRKLTCVSE